MKKFVFIFALAFTLSTAGVFADHPKGWGVGVVGGWNLGWGWNGSGGPGFGLSLKAPQIPIYWGIALHIDPHYFGMTVSGDYYFIDKVLAPQANLHWFLGIGGWLNFQSWSGYYYWDRNGRHDDSWLWFALGARLPIGLSWQPAKWIEVFADVAPSLGVGFNTRSKRDRDYPYEGGSDSTGGIYFPVGGVGFDLGVRFWF